METIAKKISKDILSKVSPFWIINMSFPWWWKSLVFIWSKSIIQNIPDITAICWLFVSTFSLTNPCKALQDPPALRAPKGRPERTAETEEMWVFLCVSLLELLFPTQPSSFSLSETYSLSFESVFCFICLPGCPRFCWQSRCPCE